MFTYSVFREIQIPPKEEKKHVPARTLYHREKKKTNIKFVYESKG